MTTSQVVFDPFSDDYFNAPYATYRRMRDDAPVYYSPSYDFYALTRHADVSAALKNTETFSSSRGVDLEMVQSGQPVPPLIIMMDSSEHWWMRSLVNKVFTPQPIDVLLASYCMTHRHTLLHRDADFDALKALGGLDTWPR